MLGRRADGFHDIDTTIQAIDLHDLLVVQQDEDTQLSITGLDVPGGARNSVLHAHGALEQATRQKLPTRFHLHKRIPPGSGMGGASSDAATALRALKHLYHLEIDLEPIAAQIGADVTYFLHGGRARATGRGEKMTPLPTQPATYLVAWPGIELSTADVYNQWDQVKGEGQNELERAAQHANPAVKDFAARLGDAWRMTGSGSAFFKEIAIDDAPHMKVWSTVAHAVGPWS